MLLVITITLTLTDSIHLLRRNPGSARATHMHSAPRTRDGRLLGAVFALGFDFRNVVVDQCSRVWRAGVSRVPRDRTWACKRAYYNVKILGIDRGLHRARGVCMAAGRVVVRAFTLYSLCALI